MHLHGHLKHLSEKKRESRVEFFTIATAYTEQLSQASLALQKWKANTRCGRGKKKKRRSISASCGLIIG